MPHSQEGLELQPGDLVSVLFEVKAVHAGIEFCNVDLDTVEPMPPYTTPTRVVLNTKQCNIFARDGKRIHNLVTEWGLDVPPEESAKTLIEKALAKVVPEPMGG